MWGGRVRILLTLVVALPALAACQAAPERKPDNPLPFGALDAPKNGEVVGRVVEVTGWALDDSRVVSVSAYVDGRFQASATPELPRPDVARLYPSYAGAAEVSGWRLELDLGEAPGARTILVRAVDDRQAARDLGSIEVHLIER